MTKTIQNICSCKMLLKIHSNLKGYISDVIQIRLSDRMAAAAAHAVKNKRKLDHKDGAGAPPFNTPARHGWGEMALELHGDLAKVTKCCATSQGGGICTSCSSLDLVQPWLF